MELKDLNTTGLSDRTKGILTGILSTVVVAGGLIIGFQDKEKPKLTYDEAQMLIKVYNHELQKSQDKNFQQIKDGNMIQKLNDKFSARNPTTTEKLDGENMSPDAYKILRSGLMNKSQQ